MGPKSNRRCLQTTARRHDHSNAKMRLQSFFMLTTIQSRFFASAISASGKVPILEAAP
jgi:hypothetical protein